MRRDYSWNTFGGMYLLAIGFGSFLLLMALGVIK